jgi:hypothetical protein
MRYFYFLVPYQLFYNKNSKFWILLISHVSDIGLNYQHQNFGVLKKSEQSVIMCTIIILIWSDKTYSTVTEDWVKWYSIATRNIKCYLINMGLEMGQQKSLQLHEMLLYMRKISQFSPICQVFLLTNTFDRLKCIHLYILLKQIQFWRSPLLTNETAQFLFLAVWDILVGVWS